MNWRTSAPVLWARGVGRTLGINRVIASTMGRRGYEAAFEEQLARLVLPGDCVWDVGANVGLYTVRFAAAVGKDGMVWAFEPSAINAVGLASSCAKTSNVKILQIALGRQDGVLGFLQGTDDLGATSRVAEPGAGTQTVQVRSGESLLSDGARRPNVVKIDVEGYELEVLEGLGPCLADPELRAIGVEVHFGILAERGKPGAPKVVERLLRESGFRIQWTDSSHILGTRVGR